MAIYNSATRVKIKAHCFQQSWNFKQSCGICPFLRNFDISAEFHGNLQKLRNDQ